MTKATIKSKTGTLITIEGTEKEVANVLAHLETIAHVGRAKEEIKKVNSEKKEQKKRTAASDLVVNLKEEGYFEKPKSLGEIAHGLEEKGYIYPITTLSGVMIGLVQKKILGRKKLDGKWVYGK